MKKIFSSIIKFRWFIVILIPLLTLLFAWQLKNIQFDGSYRIWFGKDSDALVKFDKFRSVFGNDDAIIIILDLKEGVFNKKALSTIDRLTNKLWETRFIARVDSITNYQYIHKSEEYPDEIVIENFIEDIEHLRSDDLEQKKEIALKENMLQGKLLNCDATTTMIVGRLTPKASQYFGSSKIIKDLVDGYIQDETKKTGYKFRLAGGPPLNATFSSLGKHDATTYTPLAILIAMVLLWFIFKRLSGVLLSVAVVVFTFVIVLAIQVMLGFKLNNFTANMPIFIIAIGIADAMHLYWIYLLGRKEGLDNHGAIHYSLEKNFLPTFLTSITTAIGFGSLGISEIVPIQTLGIATATAALLAFLITIIFVPAVLAIINPNIKVKKTKAKEKRKNSFAQNYASFIQNYDGKILAVTTLLFIVLGVGLFQLRVDSNTIRYFRDDVVFKQTINFIQKQLTGPMAYEVVVDSKVKDGIKDPNFMKTIEKFSSDFEEKYSDVRHISSLIDVVKKFNDVMQGKYVIPNDQNLIAQYLLLYSLSLPQGMEINDKMDVDEQRLRVTASMNVVDTSLDLEMIEWIEEWWRNTPYSAEVNGQTAMFAHMQHDVTDTLVESILLAITTVSFVMLLIFRNIRMIPLFIIPNVLPIVLVIGVMGWLNMQIDIGVAICGAIIIGVAVDDTIHFLVKYKEAREKGMNFHEALSYTIEYAGLAIVFTTIVLSLAFAIFSLSQFMPNVNFGIITTIALIIAVVVDLVMLPAILSKFDGKDKSFLQGNDR
ncbi:MMPL family transporter [Sulfurimonas sp. C5]|uniref:efflux RND transporter permease subunit n=1 Tax=Sulfurimonas sp. C5 TaxID=3036947 RepID=UPI0024571B69|nr:MMPL family transporter [Sulfurimonas sp. C5]MDH4944333.1 MMPL family transporter [Sulfurimonas sp. C5]